MFVRKGQALGSVLHGTDPGAEPPVELPAAEEPKGQKLEMRELSSSDLEGLERPKDYATKAEWVEFVVAKTAETEQPVSVDEADALSKNELIELYGG